MLERMAKFVNSAGLGAATFLVLLLVPALLSLYESVATRWEKPAGSLAAEAG